MKSSTSKRPDPAIAQASLVAARAQARAVSVELPLIMIRSGQSRLLRRPVLLGAALVWVTPSMLAAQAAASGEPDIVVLAPGAGVDSDDALELSRADLARGGRPDLIGALARQLPGVTLQDAQGNPWQPVLVYRGQTASGAQGQAQGLAAYLDGARFNSPFGDTISLDILPDAALHTVQLLDSSPVYGLNALAGALILQTATGRSDPGLTGAASASAYGAGELSVAGGGQRGDWNAFAALQVRGERGWRDFSPSRLASGYADVGFDGAAAGFHAKAVLASTRLSGNGASPVDLLAVRRSAVFTHPDRTENRFARISLHPWAEISPRTRLSASLYGQLQQTRSVNGDAADIAPCEADSALLCLETVTADGEDAAETLTDQRGRPIPARAGDPLYGVLNRGEVQSRALGILVQITDRRPLFGGTNVLTVGTSLDYGRSEFAASTELGKLGGTRGVTAFGPVIAQADAAIAPVSVVARNVYTGLFAAETLPLGPNVKIEAG
jgi:hypothetical protein